MKLAPKIVLLVSLFGLGLLFFSLIGYGLAMFIFDLELADMSRFDNYQSIQALKFVQVFVSIGTFIFPAWIFSKITGHNFLNYFDTKNLNSNLLLIVTFIGLCALPFIGWMAEMNLQMTFPESLSWLEEMLRASEESAQRITEAFLTMSTTSELLINLFVVGVLPAVGEELLFRGALQQTLIKHTKNIHFAVWLSAALFSFIHFQFFGFFPRMILGAIFGYLVVWGGSLWYSIWAHFINNGASVFLMYLIYKEKIDADFETIGGNSGDWIYVIISFILASSLLWLFYNYPKRKLQIEELEGS